MAAGAPPRRTRVLVVGGGAAGTAAAWALSRHADRFAVSLWEAAPALGGVATTECVSFPDGSAATINDGAALLSAAATLPDQ